MAKDLYKMLTEAGAIKQNTYVPTKITYISKLGTINTIATVIPIIKGEINSVFALLQMKIAKKCLSASYHAYIDGEMIRFENEESFACVFMIRLCSDERKYVLSLYLDGCQPKKLPKS